MRDSRPKLTQAELLKARDHLLKIVKGPPIRVAMAPDTYVDWGCPGVVAGYPVDLDMSLPRGVLWLRRSTSAG